MSCSFTSNLFFWTCNVSCVKAGSMTVDPMTTEFDGMTLACVKRIAVGEGIERCTVDAADNTSKPKEEVIKLILANRKADPTADSKPHDIVVSRSDRSLLRPREFVPSESDLNRPVQPSPDPAPSQSELTDWKHAYLERVRAPAVESIYPGQPWLEQVRELDKHDEQNAFDKKSAASTECAGSDLNLDALCSDIALETPCTTSSSMVCETVTRSTDLADSCASDIVEPRQSSRHVCVPKNESEPQPHEVMCATISAERPHQIVMLFDGADLDLSRLARAMLENLSKTPPINHLRCPHLQLSRSLSPTRSQGGSGVPFVPNMLSRSLSPTRSQEGSSAPSTFLPQYAGIGAAALSIDRSHMHRLLADIQRHVNKPLQRRPDDTAILPVRAPLCDDGDAPELLALRLSRNDAKEPVITPDTSFAHKSLADVLARHRPQNDPGESISNGDDDSTHRSRSDVREPVTRGSPILAHHRTRNDASEPIVSRSPNGTQKSLSEMLARHRS